MVVPVPSGDHSERQVVPPATEPKENDMTNLYLNEFVAARRIKDFHREAEIERLARGATRRSHTSKTKPGRISRFVAAVREPFSTPAQRELTFMPRLTDYPFKNDAV
jgi:hypothetical protein